MGEIDAPYAKLLETGRHSSDIGMRRANLIDTLEVRMLVALPWRCMPLKNVPRRTDLPRETLHERYRSPCQH